MKIQQKPERGRERMLDKKPPKQLLTPQEFANWLGISMSTVYRMKKEGILPIFKVSSRQYFVDAEKFMEQGGVAV